MIHPLFQDIRFCLSHYFFSAAGRPTRIPFAALRRVVRIARTLDW